MKRLAPFAEQESTPDVDHVPKPPASRRDVLKSVFVSIPVAVGLVPAIASLGHSRTAYAEPHPHCANLYREYVYSYCNCGILIIVWAYRCWDCSGLCFYAEVQSGSCN